MQYNEARDLREKNGEKPCDHNYTLEKEYYLGAATGDYACSNCGTVGWGRDWNKKRN